MGKLSSEWLNSLPEIMCPVRTGGGFDWFQFDSGSITEALTKLESLPLKSSFAHPCFYSVGLYIILVYNQKRPWCWEILKAGGKGDDRGWDSWMASPIQWHEFEQALGVDDRQGHKELETTEWLNWTELNFIYNSSQSGNSPNIHKLINEQTNPGILFSRLWLNIKM